MPFSQHRSLSHGWGCWVEHVVNALLNGKGSSYCNWLFHHGISDLCLLLYLGPKAKGYLLLLLFLPECPFNVFHVYWNIEFKWQPHWEIPRVLIGLTSIIFCFLKGTLLFRSPVPYIHPFLTRWCNGQIHCVKWGIKVPQYLSILTEAYTSFIFLDMM